MKFFLQNNKISFIIFLILFFFFKICLLESIFFDLFALNKLLNLELSILFFTTSYDVIFANSINFTTLLSAVIVSLILIIFLLTQANLLNISFYPNSTFDAEKYSPYECGFAPFRTERAQFDIKFYLVALLFLVFDVELMFLLPYCLSYYYLSFYGYIIFLLFFTILVIGFLIEWSIGMLVWKDTNTILKKKNPIGKNSLASKIKQKYLNYLIDYLLILEAFHLWKVILSEHNIPSLIGLWKLTFINLKKERFFEKELAIKFDNQKNKKNTPIFFGIEDFYIGSCEISITQLNEHIKWKAIAKWIEWFFIRSYGQPYIDWLETAAPSERYFVI